MRMDKYAVFIDGGYARKVLKEFNNPRICYYKFSTNVAKDDQRLRTYYYDCAPYMSASPTDEEKIKKSNFDKFIFALQRQPRFQIRLGRLAKYILPDGKIEFAQKKVDILLGVDLVQLSVQRLIQRAILFASDSDFVPAIQIARDAGTIVELYYHIPPKPHDELLQACDDRILINQSAINAMKL
jgi:uncharacterized LabA/DUF88 family protein